MKFYDYEVEDINFRQLEIQDRGLSSVLQEVLDSRSRSGWQLMTAAADGRILIFERVSTNVELKRIHKVGDEDLDPETHDKLADEGWFFHSSDSHGLTFMRKRP